MKIRILSTTLGVLLALAGATAAPGAEPATSAMPASAAAARSAASKPSPQLAAFKNAIRAKYDLKERAFAAHDAETIVTRFYARDVISVGAGEGIFIGRDQIRPLYEDVVKSNTVKIESVYSFVDGNAGWDWADFHVTPADGKTAPFTFAILFLWAQEHGEWMCKGDFFLVGSMKDGKLAPPPAESAAQGR
jgi:ketosteroid isomerase-like protein